MKAQTQLKAKKNLYNKGKCFTKNKIYIIPEVILTPKELSCKTIVNDLNENHIIGNFWKYFEIV